MSLISLLGINHLKWPCHHMHQLKGYEAARSTLLTINLIVVNVSLEFCYGKQAAYVLIMFCRPIGCTPKMPYYLHLQSHHLGIFPAVQDRSAVLNYQLTRCPGPITESFPNIYALLHGFNNDGLISFTTYD